MAANETTRTHVVLPPELLAEIDRRVGPRRRSQFFVDAVTEKLARLRLAEVARRAAGSLAEVGPPSWDNPEEASRSVHAPRLADDVRRAAKSEE